MTSVLLILVMSAVLVYSAILRVINPPTDLNADFMMYTAIFGLCCNIVMAKVLHADEGDEDEEESEHEEGMYVPPELCAKNAEEIAKKKAEMPKNTSKTKQSENANIRAAFIHILGDIIQSVGVVIASIIIKFNPTWVIADPICTFMFAIIVTTTTINVISSCLKVLMEGAPENMDIDKFSEELAEIKGVHNVHDLHVWSLTHGKPSMTAHINCENKDSVLRKATVLCRRYGIYHSTIQLESSAQADVDGKYYIDCGQNIH